MAKNPTKVKKNFWIARNWGKIVAISVSITAFLGGYDVFRNNGKLFVCDIARLVGQENAISICIENPKVPKKAEMFSLLTYLQENIENLSDPQRDQLRQLKSYYIKRAFKALNNAANLNETPTDTQAEEATLEAVRETFEEGDAEERRALSLIAEGDLNGGLELLANLASESAVGNAAQWRRIGRLSYAVDTTKALEAYKKVIVLDQSDIWDAIFLGRLYIRAGSLNSGHRTFTEALARLPESNDRDRSVLLNGIGDVQKEQGDLSGALESYRAAMAIRERLAKADPDNAGWQRDLSVSHEKVGDIEDAGGDIVAAIASYEKSLPIAQGLADRFPQNPQYQSDIKITKHRLAQLRSKLRK